KRILSFHYNYSRYSEDSIVKRIAFIKKEVNKNIRWAETNQEKDDIRIQAMANNGFVYIGNIKYGYAQHMALLFKIFCDSINIPCRLTRNLSENGKEVAFNVVLVVRPSPGLRISSPSSSSYFMKSSTKPTENPILEHFIPVSWTSKSRDSSAISSCQQKATISDENYSYGRNDSSTTLFRHELDSLFDEFQTSWYLPPSLESLPSSDSKNLEYALKLVPLSEENLPEAEIMRSYNHPRVIPLLGVFKGYQMRDYLKQKKKLYSLCFLMQLADTSLESTLQSNTSLSLDFIRRILLDTARAMQYLHTPASSKSYLLHRDLKPANILIKVKISLHFDCNKEKLKLDGNNEEFTKNAGTEGYIAPEQRTIAYDRPADDTFLLNLCLACLDTEPSMRPTFKHISTALIDEIFRLAFEKALRNESLRALSSNLVHLGDNFHNYKSKKQAETMKRRISFSSSQKNKSYSLFTKVHSQEKENMYIRPSKRFRNQKSS
ncbi:Tyrosine kinase-like (TKL) protein, partial [Cardiosporidium cionae]